jgi:hypothetical protein
MMKKPAWQSLSGSAKALYVELASLYFGTNNGRIVYSVRQAAKALKVSKDTAARTFEELQKRGFIVVQKKGGFNLRERKGQATEWRLTEYAHGSDITGTKEFANWSEGTDFPVARGSKPTHRRKPANENHTQRTLTPMANYKCPTAGTERRQKSGFESQEKDQNVALVPHESHHWDRLVPKGGLQVSPQGPCSEIERSGETS